MAKILRCSDIVPGCDFEVRGDTEVEILMQAAEHAKTSHKMTEIPEGLMSQARRAIRDEERSRAQRTGA